MGLEILSPGPPEVWHVVGEEGEPPYGTANVAGRDVGWQNGPNIGIPIAPTRFYKDESGVVWVDIFAAMLNQSYTGYASGFTDPIFRLPVGHAPNAGVLRFGIYTSFASSAALSVATVIPNEDGSASIFSPQPPDTMEYDGSGDPMDPENPVMTKAVLVSGLSFRAAL